MLSAAVAATRGSVWAGAGVAGGWQPPLLPGQRDPRLRLSGKLPRGLHHWGLYTEPRVLLEAEKEGQIIVNIKF